MEYPGTKFTKNLRLILFVAFILFFLTITPAVLLYTIGYRYDWQYGFLKKTGALNIDLEQKNVTVYLNGQKIKDQTIPIKLKNIKPSKYNLRIAKSGYHDWEKEIEIKEKKTVYIKEINLLKKEESKIYLDAEINDFFPSYNFKYIIYTIQKNNNVQIWLHQAETNKNTFLSNLSNTSPVNVRWANRNNCAVISNPDSHSIICADKSESQINLNQINTSAIKKIQWKETESPELYYSTTSSIFSFSLTTRQNQLMAMNQYLDWAMEDGKLWTLSYNTTSRKYELIKDALGFAVKFNELELDSGSNNFQPLAILAANNNSVLLKKNDKSEVVLLSKDKIAAFTGEKFLLSQYNHWWLIWTGWELWAYSAGEEPYLLNRSGAGLQEVWPLDKYNTLALVWKDKITALYPYYLVQHDLLNVKTKKTAVDNKNKKLYFTPKDKKGLWILEY